MTNSFAKMSPKNKDKYDKIVLGTSEKMTTVLITMIERGLLDRANFFDRIRGLTVTSMKDALEEMSDIFPNMPPDAAMGILAAVMEASFFKMTEALLLSLTANKAMKKMVGVDPADSSDFLTSDDFSGQQIFYLMGTDGTFLTTPDGDEPICLELVGMAHVMAYESARTSGNACMVVSGNYTQARLSIFEKDGSEIVDTPDGAKGLVLTGYYQLGGEVRCASRYLISWMGGSNADLPPNKEAVDTGDD